MLGSSFCYLELTCSIGVNALPWGQGYAVKSAPHILDSLPYALGLGFPLADQGWEGWWGIHWAVPWFEVVPILIIFPPLVPGTLSHTTLHTCPISQ